jgi:hypothetical protein
MTDFNARLRAQMLRQAVLQAGDNPTLATVAAWLPPDFFSTDTDEADANEAGRLLPRLCCLDKSHCGRRRELRA